MIKRLIRWLLGKKAEVTEVINNSRELESSTIEQGVIDVIKNPQQQEKEVSYFTRSNNIIDEFADGPPPNIINGDGTVYYAKGDPRNTYDPMEVKYIEDYDGSIIQIGGGIMNEVPDCVDDQTDNSPLFQANVNRINELREKWKQENKIAKYEDFVQQPKPEEDGTK